MVEAKGNVDLLGGPVSLAVFPKSLLERVGRLGSAQVGLPALGTLCLALAPGTPSSLVGNTYPVALFWMASLSPAWVSSGEQECTHQKSKKNFF